MIAAGFVNLIWTGIVSYPEFLMIFHKIGTFLPQCRMDHIELIRVIRLPIPAFLWRKHI